MARNTYLRNLQAFAKTHRILALIVGAAVLAGILVPTVVLAIFLTAVHEQSTRFGAINKEMQDVKIDIRQALGSSFTDMQEDDSCYHLEQQEAHYVGPNGLLYCGMSLQGATKTLPTSAGSNKLWGTMLRVNEVILNTFSINGLTPTLLGNASTEPASGSTISFHNSFTVFNGNVHCDIRGDSNYNEFVYPSVRHSLPDQLYFSLNCYQRSSVNVYHFVPSSLD